MQTAQLSSYSKHDFRSYFAISRQGTEQSVKMNTPIERSFHNLQLINLTFFGKSDSFGAT